MSLSVGVLMNQGQKFCFSLLSSFLSVPGSLLLDSTGLVLLIMQCTVCYISAKTLLWACNESEQTVSLQLLPLAVSKCWGCKTTLASRTLWCLQTNIILSTALQNYHHLQSSILTLVPRRVKLRSDVTDRGL